MGRQIQWGKMKKGTSVKMRPNQLTFTGRDTEKAFLALCIEGHAERMKMQNDFETESNSPIPQSIPVLLIIYILYIHI